MVGLQILEKIFSPFSAQSLTSHMRLVSRGLDLLSFSVNRKQICGL